MSDGEPTAASELWAQERRLREVAKRYWVDRRSQLEVADEFAVGRATVSRMLDEARERGIIRFQLSEAHDRMPELEAALNRAYGSVGGQLRFRVAVQFKRSIAEDDLIVGRVASRTLVTLLQTQPRRALAIASSRTMAPVVPFADLLSPLARVSELLGVSGRSAAPAVGATLAAATGATYDALVSPFVHRDVERARAARRALELEDSLSRARRAPVALLGANSTQRFDGTGGYSPVSAEMLAEGADRGAVGHVCGWFLAANGDRVSSSLDELRVGAEISDLRAIPQRVLLACGPDKAPIIGAAARAKLCTVVVTDTTTAHALLS